MSAQQVIRQPVRRNYETTSHNDIIILLGCELDRLANECNRLDSVEGEMVDDTDKHRARSAREAAYERMNDICSALSAFKAESLEAAAIQMRAVSYYSSLEYEDVERQIITLIHSVVGALESNGGFGRDQWAGIFYLGTRDAFEKVEVGA